MAIMFPISNGNWSNAANWNSDDPLRVGTVPTVGDEVYINGKNITPDIDIKVTSITNSSFPALSIAAGGYMFGFAGAERTIEALLVPGLYEMLRIDTTPGQTLNLIGGAAIGTGNYLFGIRPLHGIINFYGDYPINGVLYYCSGSAQINIYGTISPVGTSMNLLALQSIKVRIFGTVINSSTINAPAINNLNPSIPVEVLSLQHDYTKAGSHISGRFAFMTGGSYIGEDTSGNPLPLTDPTTADQALPQDVRLGVVYNNGGLTGTSKMPAKEVVSKDVVFDNGTVGEAILTAEAVSQAAAQVVGAQFNSFK
ncbi:MAG: hypothetical protein M9892_03170 [Bacteroidetes bacterium]|nr:hypothetical protein [Bacteroidota bacterium]